MFDNDVIIEMSIRLTYDGTIDVVVDINSIFNNYR